MLHFYSRELDRLELQEEVLYRRRQERENVKVCYQLVLPKELRPFIILQRYLHQIKKAKMEAKCLFENFIVCYGIPECLSRSVPVSEIISVREEDEESGSRRKDDGSWKKIKDGDGTDCRKSFTGLFPLCMCAASRPRSLLVYINPYGGKRQAKHIFEQKVAPLFAQAGISTHVIGRSCTCSFDRNLFMTNFSLLKYVYLYVAIVTDYANHARDHLRTDAEINKFDG
ncbi:hypothetical protein XENOCAPTIV_000609 [Xenoophorus captivus]|uniref:DAGKc domain-containing protein n=1 Tax=Xenoophorus captivus TaxID=1517983 RepID=A0ABV0QP13_9TELE